MKVRLAILLAVAAAAVSCSTPAERAARSLAERIAPGYSIRFREVADTVDFYSFRTVGNSLEISGNNAVSMAAGLGRYLSDWCAVSVSWDADDPVSLPPVMPRVDSSVSARALVRDRFFLNYCTFGYTLPWWGWREWERLIDWMALQGINLPLATTGEEAVWKEVWDSYGIDTKEFFTGPAHLPWHRMNNIDGLDGPLPDGWLSGQKSLQKKILKRERSLGMRAVLHAFSGHVPAQLKEKFPDAAISGFGSWAGEPEKYSCHFLSPVDPLYAEIQQKYIKALTREFGTDHIYGMDLFNEVQPPSWDPQTLAGISAGAYESLAAADPGAVWLQMGWMFYNDRRHWTPEIIQAYLGAVPQGKVVLLDYYLEHTPIWTTTESFYGQPFILCYLGNFGGNTRLAGPFRKTSERIGEALSDGGASGLGSTLEGFGVNQWMYEYVFSRAWDTGVSDEDWIDRLAARRSGPGTEGVWHTLADSVYVHGAISQAPLMAGRPCLDGWKSWTVIHKLWHRPQLVSGAWKDQARTFAARGANEPGWAERFDLVNLGIQALGNLFADERDAFSAALRAGRPAEARAAADRMQEMIDDADRLAACCPQFSLRRWLEEAAGWASDPSETAYYQRNARHLVTTWGYGKYLPDYASRCWQGLLGSFYGPRWKIFTDAAQKALEDGVAFDTEAADSLVYHFEQEFVEGRVPIEFREGGDPLELSVRLIDKYFPDRELTLATYNVGVFSKYTGDSSADIAALVRRLGVDYLALNELDSCNRRHSSFQLQEFAGLLGWNCHFARAFGFAGGAYGNGVATPHEITDAFRVDLPRFDGSEPRSVAVVETRDCVFAAVHLDHRGKVAALEQAKIINGWFTERYSGGSKPVFLLGDMNSLPQSDVVAELGKCWEKLSPDAPTYPSGAPAKCIDYIFALRGAAPVEVISSQVVDSAAGADISSLSDHCPVVCRVCIR